MVSFVLGVQVAAMSGLRVLLKDSTMEAAQAGYDRIEKLMLRAVEKVSAALYGRIYCTVRILGVAEHRRTPKASEHQCTLRVTGKNETGRLYRFLEALTRL